MHISVEGNNWSDWYSQEGDLTSAPTVVSRVWNSLDAFYRCDDGCIWHRTWYDGEWSEEKSLEQ